MRRRRPARVSPVANGERPARRPRAWFQPNRTLRLTRDGWLFLAVSLAIGFASLNTGHNLFYLIFAMQVSLIIVSGILSERSLRSLRLKRRLPSEIMARSATAIEWVVNNRSPQRTAYAVELWDSADGAARRRVGFVDRLDPGAERSFPLVWIFERRGIHTFGDVHLVTRFPFGLFEKTRILPIRSELIVYPAIESRRTRRDALDLELAVVRKNRLGEETLGFRPHGPEDDRRAIHWRVSARAGQLMVREPGEVPHRPLAIFFDGQGTEGTAFEAAVERAATILWEGCREARRIDFYAEGCVALAVGRESWDLPLGFLATVEPHDEALGGGGAPGVARGGGEGRRGVRDLHRSTGDPGGNASPGGMSFERRFVMASRGLALTGITALVITGSVGPVYLVLAVASLIWTGILGWQGRGQGLDNSIANLTILVSIALIFPPVVIRGVPPIQAIAEFLLVLTALRSLAAASDRDWLQIYALSFFELVAASALTIEPAFAALFVLYLLLAPWALVLLFLRGAVTEAGHARQLREEPFVDPSLFRSLITVTIVLFVSTVMIFVFFPRVGAGFFQSPLRTNGELAGFSDEIALGDVSALKGNPVIALRVVIDRPERILRERRYWRGAALDHFDGRQWKKEREELRPLLRAAPGLSDAGA